MPIFKILAQPVRELPHLSKLYGVGASARCLPGKNPRIPGNTRRKSAATISTKTSPQLRFCCFSTIPRPISLILKAVLPLLTPILLDSPEILVLQWESWFCKIVYPIYCHRHTALPLGIEDQKQKILEKLYQKKQSSKYLTAMTFHTTSTSSPITWDIGC